MGDQSPARLRLARRFACILITAAFVPSSAAAGAPEPVPLPDVENAHGEEPPGAASPEAAEPTEAPPLEPEAAPAPTRVPPPKVDAEIIRVAVGLTPQAPGSKAERAIVDQLERSTSRSTRPSTSVRRLRAGTGEPRSICREGTDDLVIAVGYMPDDPRPVLISHDCRLDRELPARSAQAATDPALVGVLWQEHRELVASGAKQRTRRISPRLRNGLIIGAGAIVIAVAAGLLLANALREDTVVLKVAP